MMIVSSKKKPEELGRDKNYLLLKPNIKKKTAKYYFVFNKFKTAKTFGQQIFAVPEIIEMFFDRLYYKYYPFVKGRQTPLLISNGMPLKSNSSITLILNKIFGKKIGASMLRHIYLTHKFGANYKDREMVSNKMSHSISTQHRYIKESD
jgi:integrase